MFLPDTNVLSEVLRARPSPAVIRRLLLCNSRTLFTSATIRFELRVGAALRSDEPLFWARLGRERCR